MKKLAIIATTLGFLSPLFFSSAVQARSLTSERVCLHSGEYAVFAKHPLFVNANLIDNFLSRTPSVYGILRNKVVRDFTNTDLTHEHIFFCRDSSIVNNIGFGPAVGEQNFEIVGQKITLNLIGNRFSYSTNELATGRGKDGGRLDDFVPIDNEKYNSEIVQGILSGVTAITPDRCDIRQLGDGTYLGVINNCQGFTARVQKEYWRKMFVGTWEARFPCGSGRYITRYYLRDNTLIQTVIQSGGANCLPNGHTSAIGSIPRNVSKGSAFNATIYLGTGSQSKSGLIRIIDANTFEFEGTVLRRVKQ